MYYGLTVNLPAWPPDLGLLWQEALRPCCPYLEASVAA
jgi:hypothetical protein